MNPQKIDKWVFISYWRFLLSVFNLNKWWIKSLHEKLRITARQLKTARSRSHHNKHKNKPSHSHPETLFIKTLCKYLKMMKKKLKRVQNSGKENARDQKSINFFVFTLIHIDTTRNFRFDVKIKQIRLPLFPLFFFHDWI